MTLDASDSISWYSEFDVALPLPQTELSARDRLVVALDTPTVREASDLVDRLRGTVGVYKVGLELVISEGGMRFARELRAQGKVFLDMKLLDIPNTVEKAVANAARMNFDFLTIHGIDKKTLEAACRGRACDPRAPADRLKLVSVTVLTSLEDGDLLQQGIQGMQPRDLAVHRARMAFDAGFDGVIASGHEIEPIRAATNDKFIIKVPGIRPATSTKGDQARVMTPTEARRRGATYLVIGRPITQAPDPASAARAIVREIEQAEAF